MLIVVDGMRWLDDTGFVQQLTSEGHKVIMLDDWIDMYQFLWRKRNKWILLSNNEFMSWIVKEDAVHNPWYDRKPLYFVPIVGEY